MVREGERERSPSLLNDDIALHIFFLFKCKLSKLMIAFVNRCSFEARSSCNKIDLFIYFVLLLLSLYVLAIAGASGTVY